MKYLFFIVHPSKYYFLRCVINKLNEEGNATVVLYTGRGNLGELIRREKWNSENIFPKGRKIKGVHPYISSAIYAFATVYKLIKRTAGKQYDLFITDDLLTVTGRILRVPSVLCTDDDITAVPESRILAYTADYIFSPSAAYMGKYEKKKIGYWGYKALAHLHPAVFTADKEIVNESLPDTEVYFMIRCVSLTSTHDVGRNGINDELLKKIIKLLSGHGRVIISSERKLPEEFKQYSYDFSKEKIADYVAFSRIFISDSTTMCAEAAVMGVPSIEVDDWYEDFGQYKELNGKYDLLHGFSPKNEEALFGKINELLMVKDLRGEYQLKREKMLTDSINVSEFMHWIISGYPSSINEYFKDKTIQRKFG